VTIRGTFHALIVFSSWVLFFYWWYRVLPQITGRDAAIALLLIGLTVLCTAIATFAWVRYNIGIFRRKGPRRNPTPVSESYHADSLGRKIEPVDLKPLRSARSIVISVEGEVKKYEVPKG